MDQCCLRFVRTYHRDKQTHYVFGQLNSDEEYNGRSLAYSVENGAKDILKQAMEISAVLPGFSMQTKVSTNMELGQTVIVGEVPEFFGNIGIG